jgi:hypothetical protein
VNISATVCQTKDGEVLAGAAELVVDTGFATVERAEVDMM